MLLHRPSRRHGAALVETAVVISLTLLFLMGIFEYGRFVMTLQMLEAATREGARFAIVRTNDPDADIEEAVRARLLTLDEQLDSFTVEVTAKTLRDYTTPANDGTLRTTWDDAGINDGIYVRVTANYHPMLPSFLQMPSSIPITVQTVMYSEAN